MRAFSLMSFSAAIFITLLLLKEYKPMGYFVIRILRLFCCRLEVRLPPIGGYPFQTNYYDNQKENEMLSKSCPPKDAQSLYNFSSWCPWQLNLLSSFQTTEVRKKIKFR